MKKMIAILVALMLMAMPIALAEPSFTLKDPVLKINMGEEMNLDLTGLELVLVGGELGDKAAAEILINGNGETLFSIHANVIGETVLLTADGLSNVYSIKIPADVTSSMEGLQGIQLPEIDVEGIMEILMGSMEMDGNTIRIPYTAVNDVLEKLVPAVEGLEIPGINLDPAQFADAVKQLKDTNSGITLEGSYAEADNGTAISAKAFMIQDSAASADPLFTLDVAVGEDMSFNLDIPGQASLSFATSGEKFTLAMSADGTGFELTASAIVGETEVSFVELDGANAIDVETITEEQATAMTQEVMGAAGNLINFLYGALGAAA